MIGIVVFVGIDYIILFNKNIGYKINVANSSFYKLDEEYKVYTYLVIKEDDMYLCGFKSKEEKDLFLKIIEVKGIGPKTALNLYRNNTHLEIINAINNEDTNFLKTLPNIGLKTAKQIILDLKDKLVISNYKLNQSQIDIKNALKNLGFKINDIDSVLKELASLKLTEKDLLKYALKRLNNHRGKNYEQ